MKKDEHPGLDGAFGKFRSRRPRGVRGWLHWLYVKPFVNAYDLSKDTVKPGWEELKAIWEDASRKKSSGAVAEEQIERMRDDFCEVRRIWGFTETDEPVILSGMKKEIVTLCLFSVAGLWISSAWMSSGVAGTFAIGGVLISIYCLFRACIIWYRRTVISRRKFMTFREWLMGG